MTILQAMGLFLFSFLRPIIVSLTIGSFYFSVAWWELEGVT